MSTGAQPDVAEIARLSAALDGKYCVDRQLGAGGMAIVYLAQDLRHEREVAIKVLRDGLAQSLGQVESAQHLAVKFHERSAIRMR